MCLPLERARGFLTINDGSPPAKKVGNDIRCHPLRASSELQYGGLAFVRPLFASSLLQADHASLRLISKLTSPFSRFIIEPASEAVCLPSPLSEERNGPAVVSPVSCRPFLGVGCGPGDAGAFLFLSDNYLKAKAPTSKGRGMDGEPKIRLTKTAHEWKTILG